MSKYWLLVLLIAARLGFAQLSAGVSHHVPQVAEVPMIDCQGIPCVDMTTGSGKTLRLLIDTGELNSYLTIKAAQNLGTELHALPGGDGAETSAVQQTVVPGAGLGNMPMGEFPFLVVDPTPASDQLGLKPLPLPGDGVLTFSAFKDRMLQLDYPRRLVRISEPLDAAMPCSNECSDLVIRHFGRFGPATLTSFGGFSVNRRSVDVQIDTVFTGTMLIYPDSVQKLGLQKEAKAKHKELFPFTQGGLKLVRVEDTEAGYYGAAVKRDSPLYFFPSSEPAPSVQFDATVGSGLLSRGVVTFDFKGMHMWMTLRQQ